jgi:hypothetical protein
MVRPVHQSAEIIPLIHTAKPDAVADAERYAPGEIDIMGDEQRLPASQLQDEALVSGTIVIIRQQPCHDAAILDPAPIIGFAVDAADR